MPSPKAVKEMIKVFYQKCDGRLKIAFVHKFCRTVCRPDNWGQYDDALCLATMMKLKFEIITVESMTRMQILYREEVNKRRQYAAKEELPAFTKG